MVQRGSTHQLAAAGEPAGIAPACQAGDPPANGATAGVERSKRAEPVITKTPFYESPPENRTGKWCEIRAQGHAFQRDKPGSRILWSSSQHREELRETSRVPGR